MPRRRRQLERVVHAALARIAARASARRARASGPTASAAIAAVSAESIPPDSPSTTVVKPPCGRNPGVPSTQRVPRLSASGGRSGVSRRCRSPSRSTITTSVERPAARDERALAHRRPSCARRRRDRRCRADLVHVAPREPVCLRPCCRASLAQVRLPIGERRCRQVHDGVAPRRRPAPRSGRGGSGAASRNRGSFQTSSQMLMPSRGPDRRGPAARGTARSSGPRRRRRRWGAALCGIADRRGRRAAAPRCCRAAVLRRTGWVPARRPAPAGPPARQAGEHVSSGAHEAGVQQQVARQVADQRQLGRHGQRGADARAAAECFEDEAGVAREVADGGIDLKKRDLH